MQRKIANTIIQTIQGDITKFECDAIVNAANSQLSHGGGVALAIARAAGPELIQESIKVAPVDVGSAKATTAGNLPATWVIHAVGPIWRGGMDNEEQKLYNTCKSSLQVAQELGAKTIAFPAISTGIYGYPLTDAAHTLIKACIDTAPATDLQTITFVLFTDNDFKVFSEVLAELIPFS